jgi:AcrR family transcriptional regulator
MYKLCKTEGSTQRQKEIEQILLTLMREKSYDEISVTEICDRANMPRKSFYRYFDGKEGAMQSLLYHTMSEFNNVRFIDSTRKISEEFEELFTFWKNKKEFLEAFDKSGLLGLLIESSVSFAMSEFGDVEKYMSESDSREKLISYQFLICGIMTMMVNWYRSGFTETVPNIARCATRIITKPLFENLSRNE